MDVQPVEFYPPAQMRTFDGYQREDGRVGTRNYLAVISSVNCSASVSHYVRDRFRSEDFKRDFPNVDGVIAFTHKAGCAMDPGEPQQILQRVLAGVARHPNISGYVMIGLGCEVNQVDAIRKAHKLDELRPSETTPTFMNIQATGGVRKTVEAGARRSHACSRPPTNCAGPRNPSANSFSPRTAAAPTGTAASRPTRPWAGL